MAETRKAKQRTDEIRSRRASRSRQAKLGRRKPLAAAPTPPPVMARYSASVAARGESVRRKGKSTSGVAHRKRYDVALDSQGAEMRLPALPRVRVGWRLISLALVALLGFVLYNFWNAPVYRVDAAEVRGLHYLTSSDINEALGVTGKRVFTLDASAMASQLVDAFPQISSVSVQVSLPQTVMITVTERSPVLIWYQDAEWRLVDAEGVTFPASDEAIISGFPVINANGDPPQLESLEEAAPTLELPDLEELAEEISRGAATAGEAKQLLSADMVETILLMARKAPGKAQLVYDPEHGLGWKDQRGWTVYLGDMQDFDMKINVYQALISHLKEADIRPALISVEYVHTPYFVLEE
ncbi:MAG: FtsQ-type POTRA domain-containing protein [Anaerolineales bacterium]|nr:FtsQ-type POTRA domain-containing protein [Anaerolineales bacterium]